jgi:hypothetical protein
MTLFRDEVLTKYVPAVAVKRATQVLIDLTRRKVFVGGLEIFFFLKEKTRSIMKARPLKSELFLKPVS